MEAVVAVLTDEHQALLRTIALTGMPADRTRLAGVMGIYLDRHTTRKQGFVGDKTVQLSKGPFRRNSIGLALPLARVLAHTPFCTLSDIDQMLQANEGMWKRLYDVFAHDMIGVLLQPSLSSADRHQAAGSGTSAFLLKTLSQSCIMVGLGNDLFTRIKGTVSFGRTADGQVANTDINPYDILMG